MKSLNAFTHITHEISFRGEIQSNGDTGLFLDDQGGRRLVRTCAPDEMTLAMIPEVAGVQLSVIPALLLKQIRLPRAFVLRVYPEGDEVVMSFGVPAKGARTSFWSKRVSVQDWDLGQLHQVVGWVNEARAGS